MWLRTSGKLDFTIDIPAPFMMTPDTIDVAPGTPFDDVASLPDAVLTYLLPSRYCESERFFAMANDIVRNVAPGYDQVACISDWIHGNVHFNPASEYDDMSATEVNLRRAGVCRDFAHLGIALCRGLCIPARMVVGYLHGLQPINLHAWFEAYVGGRVAVACGHDAANVAIFSQCGPALSPSVMRVGVELPDAAPDWPRRGWGGWRSGAAQQQAAVVTRRVPQYQREERESHLSARQPQYAVRQEWRDDARHQCGQQSERERLA